MATLVRSAGPRPVPGAAAFADARLEWRRLLADCGLLRGLFGPALISGHPGQAWIYVAGPLADALLAVALAWALRGPPSRAANEAAQGAIIHQHEGVRHDYL